MTAIPVFEEMQLERPSFDDLKQAHENLMHKLDDAQDAASAINVMKEWDALRGEYGSWYAITSLRFNQDTENEAYKAERDYSDELSPKVTELSNQLKSKLLAHPSRHALQEQFGDQAFSKWDFDQRSYDPKIEEDSVAVSKLKSEYTKLLASARFEIDDETCNMSTLGRHLVKPDRDFRRMAQGKRWNWFSEHSERTDSLFDELTKLRHGMAQKLGLKDFVELGYLNMHRIDYNRDDVKLFRKQIREEIVPLASELRKQQAERLGVDKLMFWDEPVGDPDGNPAPKGDHDWMVDRAQEMFDELHPKLGAFFKLMREKHLLDLKSRDGKAGGGFCTSFAKWGVPFIFANFNGTLGDVDVFTHEMGHAFQNYSSQQAQPLNEYYWPTYESAEIHSMSLEFLCYPFMDKFFGDDADRYRRHHLTDSILFLPYGTAVDHFQHMVYDKPDATPAERREMWQEVERTYLPWRDYGDLPHAKDGGFWQLQRHIYLSPFYYIDYVLAQTCALQFWAKAEGDRESALNDYVELCARGGSLPFQGLVKSAGLRSPFEEGCLSGVVSRARDWLAA